MILMCDKLFFVFVTSCSQQIKITVCSNKDIYVTQSTAMSFCLLKASFSQCFIELESQLLLFYFDLDEETTISSFSRLEH